MRSANVESKTKEPSTNDDININSTGKEELQSGICCPRGARGHVGVAYA